MKPVLTIDVRNSRLKSFLVTEAGTRVLRDVVDRHILEKLPGDTVSVTIGSSVSEPESTSRIQVPFVMSSLNALPVQTDCRLLIEPIIRQLAEESLKDTEDIEHMKLCFLVPMCGSENLLHALNMNKFRVNDTLLTPVGLLDELQIVLHMVDLRLRLAEEDCTQEMVLFLVMEVDTRTAVLQFGVVPTGGLTDREICLTEIFFIDEAESRLKACSMEKWAVVSASDHGREAGRMRDFMEILRRISPCGECLNLAPIHTQEALDCFFRHRDIDGTLPSLVRLTDYIGVTSFEKPVIGPFTPHRYPTERHKAVDVTFDGQKKALLHLFRGHVSDPRFCRRFFPIEIPPGQERTTIRTTVTVSDVNRAELRAWRESAEDGTRVTVEQRTCNKPHLVQMPRTQS